MPERLEERPQITEALDVRYLVNWHPWAWPHGHEQLAFLQKSSLFVLRDCLLKVLASFHNALEMLFLEHAENPLIPRECATR